MGEYCLKFELNPLISMKNKQKVSPIQVLYMYTPIPFVFLTLACRVVQLSNFCQSICKISIEARGYFIILPIFIPKSDFLRLKNTKTTYVAID